MTSTVSTVDEKTKSNSRNIKQVEKKLSKIQEKNKTLESENAYLKEKVLDLEFRQRRNNLIFEGILDSDTETDLECTAKLRRVLKSIPGLDVNNFKVDRCHRLDGHYNPSSCRRLICAFNWHHDIQCILKN